MGMLDGSKSNHQQPTLLEDIGKSSEWIVAALNSSGYKCDFSIESLKEIDRFFDENFNDSLHQPKEGGLLTQNMGQRLFAIACYVGETVIKACGGVWITDDNDEYGEINIAVKFPNNSMIWPVQRLMKRCKEGPENDIYNYAMVVMPCIEQA